MKNIIVYTREVKAQNLYPKRIISPPASNKCCSVRMEVLGRPRVDEHGRRFCYKRCKVCGFALRYFLDAVGTVIPPSTPESRGRKSLPTKETVASTPPTTPTGGALLVARKPPVSRHVPAPPPTRRPHALQSRGKGAIRRRR